MLNSKTYVYVDGFNLYYGALKNKRGCKWLNLESWLSKILPQNEIVKIKYFTAKVTGKYDPHQPIRQSMYFRALRTLPAIEIVEGAFLFKSKSVYINHDVSLIARMAEEKGSDVNLAAHLINDAHLGRFDVAVVISNDSDLADPLRIVSTELGLKVGLISPYGKFNKQIAQYASFKIPAREGAIMASQFQPVLTDIQGRFSKPPEW